MKVGVTLPMGNDNIGAIKENQIDPKVKLFRVDRIGSAHPWKLGLIGCSR